jgi:hypothetical protein
MSRWRKSCFDMQTAGSRWISIRRLSLRKRRWRTVGRPNCCCPKLSAPSQHPRFWKGRP